MSFKAQFNTNANGDHALARAADPRMRELVRRCQVAVDGLRPIYAGQPLETIKQPLQQAWASATGGAQIKDPLLTKYAKAIQTGQAVKLKYVGLKK